MCTINVAPQWQVFNNGNWKAVEMAVRSYAEQSGAVLRVITGTLGQLALSSDDGVNVRLFLSFYSRVPTEYIVFDCSPFRLYARPRCCFYA